MIKRVMFEMEKPEKADFSTYIFIADIIDKQIRHAHFLPAIEHIEQLAELMQNYPGLEKEKAALKKIVEGANEMLCIPAIADKLLADQADQQREERIVEAIA